MKSRRPSRSASTGLPVDLARIPFGVVRPADAAAVYAHPRTQVARLAARGLLHALAPGYYAVVPRQVPAADWLPTLEAAAFGVAAAAFGVDDVVLMGVSAARLHGVVPRALATAVVAAPVQRRPMRLLDRPGQVLFVRRDTSRLDAERMTTDLGSALVTTAEQTVLDLAHRPDLGDVPLEAHDAAVTLLDRCDHALLTELAKAQRLQAALKRARKWALR